MQDDVSYMSRGNALEYSGACVCVCVCLCVLTSPRLTWNSIKNNDCNQQSLLIRHFGKSHLSDYDCPVWKWWFFSPFHWVYDKGKCILNMKLIRAIIRPINPVEFLIPMYIQITALHSHVERMEINAISRKYSDATRANSYIWLGLGCIAVEEPQNIMRNYNWMNGFLSLFISLNLWLR